MKFSVAHIDDNLADRKLLESYAAEAFENLALEYSHASFASVEDFLQDSRSSQVDILFLDLHLEKGFSLDDIQQLQNKSPKAEIIVFSNDLKKVSLAMQRGASDFVRKNADGNEIVLRLRSLARPFIFRGENISQTSAFVGETAKKIGQRIPRILESAVRSVLVKGESGTGKEIVAQLFKKELKPGIPFVSVNCAAIVPSLLERELFGHIKGAFTGATTSSRGFLAAAHGGWLFLDELASLSLPAQAALLRVLETGEMTPLGAHVPTKVDVRILAATHMDLPTLVKQGEFRLDLWQRLREVLIEIPPLRERPEEIPLLIQSFAKEMAGGPYVVSPEAMSILCSEKWNKGNIRELRNCLRAMTEKQINRILSPVSIPPWVFDTSKSEKESPDSSIVLPYEPSRPFEEMATSLLCQMIARLLNKTPNLSMRDCAAQLDIPKSSFSTKVKKLLSTQSFDPQLVRQTFLARMSNGDD